LPSIPWIVCSIPRFLQHFIPCSTTMSCTPLQQSIGTVYTDNSFRTDKAPIAAV
jgi:hypothetical protein